MSAKAAQLSEDLLKALSEELPKLTAISEAEAQTRSGFGSGWSRKVEMGHLIDSATNNRVRFASGALAGSYSGPSYDGDGWVRLGAYETMAWSEILELWSRHNRALATLVANIADEKLTVECHIGGAPAVTLAFLIEDYILHMQHHLDHVLGREVSTSYPGAAMGV